MPQRFSAWSLNASTFPAEVIVPIVALAYDPNLLPVLHQHMLSLVDKTVDNAACQF